MKRLHVLCTVWVFGFAIHPLCAQIVVVGELTHSRQTFSGESYTGTLTLSNIEKVDREAKIYQTDYSFSHGGKRFYGDPGSIPRSNAEWITFNPEQVTIPPGGTSTVFYTVRVPDDTSLIGTYWSVLMVEEIPLDSPESDSSDSEEFSLGIRQVFRFAIQIVTHISDTGVRNLEFLDITLEKGEEKRSVLVDVRNTGERWLRAECIAELYDQQGAYVTKLEGGKRRLYPDTSLRFTVDVTDVADGTYTALIIFDCGDDYVFGGMYTLVID